jgi:hypothetical protein
MRGGNANSLLEVAESRKSDGFRVIDGTVFSIQEDKMTANQLHPIQKSVHDWTVPGTPVWTDVQGYLCPELETPKLGETVIYVDYEKVPEDSLIQADIELAIDALGYPSGSRWIGRNSLDVDNVVSYVATVPSDEAPQHLEKLQQVVPAIVLVTIAGK